MDRTRGAYGDVAGVARVAFSPSCEGAPSRLYRLLLCELCRRGRFDAPLVEGALAPFPFMPVRLGFDCEDERVVGGEDLLNHELRVDVDLFCGRSLTSPSLLELPEDVVLCALSSCLKDSLDRRRMLSRKDGIFSRRTTGVSRSQRLEAL